MIKKIQKVELQIRGDVRVRGDVVTLTANLSDLELEGFRSQAGTLTLMVRASRIRVRDQAFWSLIRKRTAGKGKRGRRFQR
jgi:hypothetical protein